MNIRHTHTVQFAVLPTAYSPSCPQIKRPGLAEAWWRVGTRDGQQARGAGPRHVHGPQYSALGTLTVYSYQLGFVGATWAETQAAVRRANHETPPSQEPVPRKENAAQQIVAAQIPVGEDLRPPPSHPEQSTTQANHPRKRGNGSGGRAQESGDRTGQSKRRKPTRAKQSQERQTKSAGSTARKR